MPWSAVTSRTVSDGRAARIAATSESTLESASRHSWDSHPLA